MQYTRSKSKPTFWNRITLLSIRREEFNTSRMHWAISNFPWKPFAIWIALVLGVRVLVGFESEGANFVSVAISVLSTVTCGGIIIAHFIILVENLDKAVDRIVATEFINNRPMGVANSKRRNEILNSIFINVNKQIITELKTNYVFKNTDSLISYYNRMIFLFTARYARLYKDLPIDRIKGEDKIMLVAKNIYDEDYEHFYGTRISLDTIKKYSTIKPST